MVPGLLSDQFNINTKLYWVGQVICTGKGEVMPVVALNSENYKGKGALGECNGSLVRQAIVS